MLKPEPGCEVLINLEVRNQETGELIESESEQSLSVLVGDLDVIHGVDLALLTMHIGEVAEILVKPLVGYGPMGKQPDIPPNCFLLCKTELLKITWPNEMVCESLDALHHYFRMAKRKKERGCFFFLRNDSDISTAHRCYAKSRTLLNFIGQQLRKNEITGELAAINELAIEHKKITLEVLNELYITMNFESGELALEFINQALEISPVRFDFVWMVRKARALARLRAFDEAITLLNEIESQVEVEVQDRGPSFRNVFLTISSNIKRDIKRTVDEQDEQARFERIRGTQNGLIGVAIGVALILGTKLLKT